MAPVPPAPRRRESFSHRGRRLGATVAGGGSRIKAGLLDRPRMAGCLVTSLLLRRLPRAGMGNKLLGAGCGNAVTRNSGTIRAMFMSFSPELECHRDVLTHAGPTTGNPVRFSALCNAGVAAHPATLLPPAGIVGTRAGSDCPSPRPTLLAMPRGGALGNGFDHTFAVTAAPGRCCRRDFAGPEQAAARFLLRRQGALARSCGAGRGCACPPPWLPSRWRQSAAAGRRGGRQAPTGWLPACPESNS